MTIKEFYKKELEKDYTSEELEALDGKEVSYMATSLELLERISIYDTIQDIVLNLSSAASKITPDMLQKIINK